ncbi:MAG: VanW family protein [Clostridia bacterium]|nr:VanW family protein [Clostridia bacterium]
MNEEEKKAIENEEKVVNTKNEKKEEIKQEEVKKEESKHEVKKEGKHEVKKQVDINSKEYIEEKYRKKRKRIKIAIVFIVLILVIGLLSTVFGIITVFNNKIISKIIINGIDVSGMTQSQAKDKLEDELKDQLSQTLEFKYEDYDYEFKTEDIDIEYRIDDAVKEAYSRGRDSNLIVNNFNVITNFFKKEEIQIEVKYNEEELEKIVNTMGNNIPGKVIDYLYCIEEDELIITPGKAGLKLDSDKTKEMIKDRIVNIKPNKELETIKLPVYQSEPGKIDIEKIYKEVHTEPKDAYIERDPFKIVVDEDGVDFAISMEEAKKIVSEKKDEYIIPLTITKANKTVADLGDEAFPDKLSNFTTKYDASNYNRTTNLTIATEKLNGKVVLPGETFSYNKALGKRTVENGYKEAAIYVNGKVEDGLGGGICQISSTLYNAVVLANLEVVERSNHMFITSYVDASRDATVSYGSLDFQFKNTRKYPVKIVASTNSGIASISIYGLKEEQEYTVKITDAVTGSIPFETEEIPDPSLPEGQTEVVQNGWNGCRSVAYKELYTESGEFVSKTLLSSDTYDAMKRVVKVGTQKAAPQPAPAAPVIPSDPATPTVSETPTTLQPATPEPTTTPEPTPTPGN